MEGGWMQNAIQNLCRCGGLLLLGLWLLLAWPQEAVAAFFGTEPEEEAQRLSKAAEEAFQAGNFEAALEAYQEANRLVPHPILDLNIGRVYGELDQPEQMALHCKAVLMAQDVPEAVREVAQACFDKASLLLVPPALAVQTIPEGAVIYIDGREMGVTPWHGQLAVGPHQLAFKREDFLRAEHEISLDRGVDRFLSVTLHPVVYESFTLESTPNGAELKEDDVLLGVTPMRDVQMATGHHRTILYADGYEPFVLPIDLQQGEPLFLSVTMVPSEWNRETREMWPFWSLLGGSIATLGAGIGLGIAARDARNEANRIANNAASEEDRGRYNGKRDEYQRYSLGADILFVASGAMLTAGLIWWLWPEE